MMVVIHTKNNHIKDREYIYDVVFSYFWGLEYEIVYEERDNLALEVEGNYFFIDDSFFQMDESIWLKEESLPKKPLQKIELPDALKDAAVEKILPVIYGRQGIKDIFSEDGKTCFLDIFGSAFFMLTRYEEVVKDDKDEYDRFPAKASLAYQEGFLERPIINEYLEILWQWLTKYEVNLKRKKRSFSIIPTHDVDHPLWGLNVSNFIKLKVLMGDLIKRCSIKRFIFRVKEIYGLVIKNGVNSYNNFEEIMNMDEGAGLKGIYFLMNQMGKSDLDGNYDINDKRIQEIIKSITQRNHVIGLHPSFCTYKSKENLQAEVNSLKKNLGVTSCDKFGARQHFLRWEYPTTWQIYNEAGINYDMTVGYADWAGYRCGTCYEYPVFNVKSHKRLDLMEYPLIVMDSTIFERQYMGLSENDAISKVLYLREQCKKYGGNFVILWHNTSFMLDKNWKVYKQAINEV